MRAPEDCRRKIEKRNSSPEAEDSNFHEKKIHVEFVTVGTVKARGGIEI